MEFAKSSKSAMLRAFYFFISYMTDACIIHVNRRWETEISTISDFFIEGTTVKGFFLEEKGPSSTVPKKELRIPAGEYKLVWHSGRFGFPLPKLYNAQVSPERQILIHHGNTAKDTEGCLIAGTSRKPNRVEGSRLKLDEILAVLHKTKIENCRVIIAEDYQ